MKSQGMKVETLICAACNREYPASTPWTQPARDVGGSVVVSCTCGADLAIAEGHPPLYEFAVYRGDEVEQVALNGRIISTRIVEQVTDDGVVRFEHKDSVAVQGIPLSTLIRGESWRLATEGPRDG